jgi:serine-type D-Ala-D-Ala carboxypeptidase/endopeptidase (penicillin-binding protein 4)
MKNISQVAPHRVGSRFVLPILAALTVGFCGGSKAQATPEVGQLNTQIQTIEASQQRAWNQSCPHSLSQSVHSILSRSYIAQNGWGVLIESLDQGAVLYSHNADRHFIPASNTKIFTTAAALQSLGPQYPIRSQSLSSWVNTVNTYSNNGYADFLLKAVGGQQAVRSQLWHDLGIDPNQYRQRDGSGLSRYNLASPTTLVNTLRGMSRTPNWSTFYYSLPSAGETGTLRNRLKAPEVRGKVRAKTGTLYGVRALSGYLQHAEYGPLTFSILANQSSQPGAVLVKTIDEIVLKMAQSHPCRDAAAL